MYLVTKLNGKFNSLEKIGLAAEYFPHYVNSSPAPHMVDVVLLSLIIRGRGSHLMGDRVFYESGQSVAVTHYGEPHTIITDENGMDILNIYLDLENFALPLLSPELSRVLPLFIPAHPAFYNNLNRLVRVEFDNIETPAFLAFEIERELRERRPGHLVTALDYLRLFLGECCRQIIRTGIAAPRTSGNPALLRLEKVRQHLEAHFAEDFSLDELAVMAGLSKNYLCRAFRQYTGQTVFGYLIGQRIQQAMMMIRNTGDKMFAVAWRCGFRDLSYFNRTFKRLTSVSPAAYRRQIIQGTKNL
jgi:AraC-like DNA-binding protein